MSDVIDKTAVNPAVNPNYHLALKDTTIVEPTPRWIRAKFNGVTVSDSKHVLYVLEPKNHGAYYFPKRDVRTDLLTETGHSSTSAALGTASILTLTVGDKVSEAAAWTYSHPEPAHAELSDYITFRWNKVDRWFEEEEEIFVHARNPYHRVDVAKSSRHVQVVVGGKDLVESRRPWLLFETSLPTRYYFEPDDIHFEYLEPSKTESRCPYKGIATYWSFKADDTAIKDIAWSYQDPIAECPRIKGLIAFFNERVDQIIVDGEVQPVPQNIWTRK